MEVSQFRVQVEEKMSVKYDIFTGITWMCWLAKTFAYPVSLTESQIADFLLKFSTYCSCLHEANTYAVWVQIRPIYRTTLNFKPLACKSIAVYSVKTTIKEGVHECTAICHCSSCHWSMSCNFSVLSWWLSWCNLPSIAQTMWTRKARNLFLFIKLHIKLYGSIGIGMQLSIWKSLCTSPQSSYF